MYHIPVLLKEAVEGLGIRPGGIYADLTYGGNSFSAEILKHLGEGRLLAFDQDEEALKNKIDDDRLVLIHANFRFLKNFVKLYKAFPLDGILADLGISSYQIDTGERGFSTRFEAPLDLRMNRMSPTTAAQIINEYSEEKLKRMLGELGEIHNAAALASRICIERSQTKIETTGRLMEIIGKMVIPNRLNKYAAQVFQALRIEVNDELQSLMEMLQQTTSLLKPGGRLVVISYHSLEDRLVKTFMRSGNFEGKVEKDFFGNPITPFRVITRKPITPTALEQELNPRSRSAKLRIAERLSNEK